MVAGVFLLIVLLLLGPIASRIPAAVLAGILVVVGIGVMDYKGLKAVTYLPKDLKIGPLGFSSEVLIMGLVLVLSSIWNLVYAVGIGLVIAALLFMKKMGIYRQKVIALVRFLQKTYRMLKISRDRSIVKNSMVHYFLETHPIFKSYLKKSQHRLNMLL